MCINMKISKKHKIDTQNIKDLYRSQKPKAILYVFSIDAPF